MLMRGKRLLLILLIVMLSLPAAAPAMGEDASILHGYVKSSGYDYVLLGSYPTEADGTVKPIIWRVLRTNEGYAYLLSEYILFGAPVHGDYEHYAGWEKSDLYQYLNTVFLNDAFSKEEQGVLANRTEDNALVTLITVEEMRDASIGFSSNNARLCESTAYAKILPDPPIFELPASNNKGRWKPLYIYSKGRKYSPWWSRTRSDDYQHEQRRVMDEGKIGRISTGNSDLGVRPAVHVDLSLVTILQGDGTFTNPYVLSPSGGASENPQVPETTEEQPALQVPEITQAPNLPADPTQAPASGQPAPSFDIQGEDEGIMGDDIDPELLAILIANGVIEAPDDEGSDVAPVPFPADTEAEASHDPAPTYRPSSGGRTKSGDSVFSSHPTQAPANVSEPIATAAPVKTEEPAIVETQVPVTPAPTAPPAAPINALPTVSPEELAIFFASQGENGDETPPNPVKEANAPEDKPTAAPTESVPVASETEESTSPEPTDLPEPTAEPTAQPVLEGPYSAAANPETIHEKFPALTSQGFLPEGEEEFVYIDEVEGLWLYASQTLRIEINRRTGINSKKEPLRWYEAQIFTKDESERFDFFPYDKEHYTSYGDRYKASVDKIAAMHQAVFAINSDYFIYRIERDHEESYNYPIGVIIRDGEVLYDRPKSANTTSYPPLDVMALYPDGTVTLHKNASVTAKELLAAGATDTLSFGPILVENGETSPRSKEFGNTPNPRTAFGMVQPGYYIAVMVESRIAESKGESCVWLGEKMAELGCESAINLDGGATSVMMFMGKQINKSGNYGDITNRPQNELFGIGHSENVK